MMPLERSTELPPLRRRRRRVDWVRHVARALCVVLAIVGCLPMAVVLVARSAWAQKWAVAKTGPLLAEQGIHATYDVRLRVWPLAIELDDVKVESTDGLGPALTTPRVRIRPRFFALLSGKLAIDTVEVDAPRIRVVVKDGQLANLSIKKQETKKTKEPFKAPFDVFSVTDAEIDATVDDMHGIAHEVDLDVTSEVDIAGAPAIEIALRAAGAQIHMSRLYGDDAKPKLAIDDDVLCALEARVRYEEGLVTIRRLDANGSADLDNNEGTAPHCDLPHDDKRRVEIGLSQVHVYLPEDDESDAPPATTAPGEAASKPPPKPKLPRVDGHVRVRAPLGLAERAAALPETDGWIGFEGDVRYGEDTAIPDVAGRIEAHDIRLAQYNFAHEVDADILVRGDVIKSKQTKVWLGDGLVTLSDVTVDPLAPGGLLRSAKLDITNLNFASLLRDLGIHKHPHVGWDIRELHSPQVSGTFAPLHLDLDFTAQTKEFGVYDRPAEDPARGRIVGFSQSKLAAHVAVRPDGVHFQGATADVGDGYTSHLAGGNVLLGFHEVLRVDAIATSVDLKDISPIGPVKMAGIVNAEVHVDGDFHKPHPFGTIKTIKDYQVADVKFGDVFGGNVDVDITKPWVELRDVSAKVRGNSDYEVTTARLDFGGGHGFVVDAFANSGVGQGARGFMLDDFLWMFSLDQDPRFDEIDARLTTQGARVHVALGGPEDKCGTGYIEVRAKTHLADVVAFGEHFVDGDGDLEMRWTDRARGIAGADADVRSFVLRKATRAGKSLGTILGSASIREGGALNANVIVDGLELSQLQSLGDWSHQVDGRVSAVAAVDGMLDEFSTAKAPGFTVRAEAQVSPVHVRRVPFGASSVRVTMRHDVQRRARAEAIGTTKCGAPMGPPFDKASYLTDTSKHGFFQVDGDLFDKQVHLHEVVMTREKYPLVTGTVQLAGLDLGPVSRALAAKPDDPDALPTTEPIDGSFSGTLLIQALPLANPAGSKAELWIGDNTVLQRGDSRVVVVKPDHPLVVQDDTLKVETLELLLSRGAGFSGKVTLVGGVTELSRGKQAQVGLQATLTPIKLDALHVLFPQIERARGTVEGYALISGPVAQPAVQGTLDVRAQEIMLHGMPGPFTEVSLDVRANARALTATGNAKFGGGTLALRGDVPLKGFTIGYLDSTIVARGVHLSPADGVDAVADADLHLSIDPQAAGAANAKLPHVTGEVVLESLTYTRNVNLTSELSFGGSKRTEVESYDPLKDALVINVYVRSRTPLVIKNNLADVSFGIENDVLEVTGTDQRVALAGALRANPNGHFRFQGNDFTIEQALIRFDDPTRIAASVDVTAKTEYRRYTDSTAAGAAAGAANPTAAAAGTRSGALWRITLHAYGNADNLHLDLTSDPALSQEDIILLLTVGMTRAELDQLQASSLGATIALNYLGAASGADRVVKNAVPIIDDFRFGSGYSARTFKSEPQLTVGKRLADNVRATVTTGLVAEDRELRSNIEVRLNNQVSVQGTYDNINDVASSSIGNIGLDLRWHLEFE